MLKEYNISTYEDCMRYRYCDFIPVRVLVCQLNRVEVTHSSRARRNTNASLINCLTIKIEVNNASHKLSFQKSYPLQLYNFKTLHPYINHQHIECSPMQTFYSAKYILSHRLKLIIGFASGVLA